MIFPKDVASAVNWMEWNAYRNPDVRRSLIRAEVDSLAIEGASDE